MDYVEVKLTLGNHDCIEAVANAFVEQGSGGVVIDDPQLIAAYANRGQWDDHEFSDELLAQTSVEVKGYFADDEYFAGRLEGLREAVAQICMRMEQEVPQFYFNDVAEEDWANNWKQYFKPFPVGEKLYIRPSWEHDEPEAGRTVLEIDPESSFGTGQHHTTRLCLELMESEAAGSKMLDMGCGSGILFIGGMLLGAKEVFAVDIEENAVRIAKKNAAENHLPEGSYTVRCGNVLSDEALRAEIGSGYDLITANIVADVLKAMAPLFPQFLKKTGTLIISGIIVERKDEVIAAMEAQGFVVTDCREKEGWAAVKLKQAE